MKNNMGTESVHGVRAAAALLLVLAILVAALVSVLGQVGVLYATTNTFNGIGFNIVVSGVCTPVLSNALINFGSVAPGSFAPTANVENIQDVGSVSSNIVLYSTSTTTGNWIYNANSFMAGNTVWDGATHASAIVGNQLTNTITTDTEIYVPVSSSNDLYFGLNVPVGQQPGTYTQGITVSLSC